MWAVNKINVVNRPGIRGYVRGFGEDGDHELYVMASREAGPKGRTGTVYRMVPPE
jgi:hypothetical protein